MSKLIGAMHPQPFGTQRHLVVIKDGASMSIEGNGSNSPMTSSGVVDVPCVVSRIGSEVSGVTLEGKCGLMREGGNLDCKIILHSRGGVPDEVRLAVGMTPQSSKPYRHWIRLNKDEHLRSGLRIDPCAARSFAPEAEYFLFAQHGCSAHPHAGQAAILQVIVDAPRLNTQETGCFSNGEVCGLR